VPSDPTFPPYYVVKNHILAASALDDWNDADKHRITAEVQYRISFHDASLPVSNKSICCT
jgi:hypothetical protein